MHNDWIDGVEKRLIDLETHNAVNSVHRANVADCLLAIEDTLKWLVRLIIGALIVGGVTYVMQGGFKV